MEAGVKAPPKKAIVFAWLIEGCAVVLGMVNAYMTSLDRVDLPWHRAALMSAPFLMIAVAELARIPLVNLFFYTRQRLIAWACMGAVIATAGLTIENFAFGIERLVTLRVENITDARKEETAAKADLARIIKLRDDSLEGLDEKRKNLQASRNDAVASVKRYDDQIAAVEEGRQRDTAQHTERCKAAGSRCNSAQYLKTINDQANSQLLPLQAERSRANASVAGVEEEIRKIVAEEALIRRRSESETSNAENAIAEATRNIAQIIDDSQMHRFAAMWATANCLWIQGKENCNFTPQTVSDEQFNTVRTFFSFFSATIISALGSMLAIGYYSEGKRQNHDHRIENARMKFWRGLRAFLARRRKRLVRTVEKVVEVPVDREVERIVEVTREVPVDRIVPQEVIKEILVERLVEKPVEVVKEVPVDRIVEKIVTEIKEVPVTHEKIVEVVREVPVEVQKVVKEIVEKPVVHVKEMIKYVPESWRGAVETKEPSATTPADTAVVVELEPKRAHQ